MESPNHLYDTPEPSLVTPTAVEGANSNNHRVDTNSTGLHRFWRRLNLLTPSLNRLAQQGGAEEAVARSDNVPNAAVSPPVNNTVAVVPRDDSSTRTRRSQREHVPSVRGQPSPHGSQSVVSSPVVGGTYGVRASSVASAPQFRASASQKGAPRMPRGGRVPTAVHIPVVTVTSSGDTISGGGSRTGTRDSPSVGSEGQKSTSSAAIIAGLRKELASSRAQQAATEAMLQASLLATQSPRDDVVILEEPAAVEPRPTEAEVPTVEELTLSDGTPPSDDTYEYDSFVVRDDWTRVGSSCKDPGCGGGCARSSRKGGGVAAAAAASPVSRPSFQSTRGHGHVRGPYAASSTSTSRSGGVNLANAAIEVITSGSGVAMSFLDEATTERVREVMGDEPDPLTILDSDYQLRLRKDQRKQEDDTGYLEEKDRITRAGDYSIKESKKFGGWQYEASSEVTKSGKKEEILKCYQANAKKFQEMYIHIRQYDLGQLLEAGTLKPGVSNKLTTEELKAMSVHDLFDFTYTSKHSSMMDRWPSLTVDHVALLQRMYRCHPSIGDEDKVSNTLLYQLVRNSLTEDFKRTIDYSFEECFKPEERGGITFLYTVLRKVLIGSKTSVEALNAEFARFKQQGPKLLKNGGVENIATLCEYLKVAVVNPLAAMDGFEQGREDPVQDVLCGLSKSSCPIFAEVFRKLLQDRIVASTTDMSALTFLSKRDISSREIGDEILRILEQARAFYEALVLKGEYVGASGKTLTFATADTSGSTPAAYLRAGCKCFNCDGPHLVEDCPKERDEARIAKKKAEFLEAKKKRGKSGGKGAKNDGVPTRDSKGETGDKPKKDWRLKPKSRGKVVEFKCNVCERWGNHNTKFHEQAKAFGPKFLMSKVDGSHAGVKRQQEIDADTASFNEKYPPPSSASKSKEEKESALAKYEKEKKNLEARLSAAEENTTLHAEITKDLADLRNAYLNFG